MSKQGLYISIYTSYGYTFGIFVIPVVIVTVLNARLGLLLHRVRHEFTEKGGVIKQSMSLRVYSKRDPDYTVGVDIRSDLSEDQCRNRNPLIRGEEANNSLKLNNASARATGRLFCRVSVFITFQSLPMVDNLLQAFMSDLVKAIFPNYSAFYAICQFSVMVNSSLNAVLYCFLGQRFRATFWKMIQGWRDDCYSFFALVSCTTCQWRK